MKILYPPRLKQGDLAALVAPAFRFERRLFDSGRKRLERDYSLSTVVSKDVYNRDHYFAGTDRRRAGELFRWLTDPKTQAVIAIRGGYGCARIYPELIKKLRACRGLKPKIVAGYSDLTILLNGLHQDLGWITFHSPAVSGRAFREPLALEQEAFRRSLFSRLPLGPVSHPRLKTLVPGRARGRIVGGCLSLLVSSLGTSYEIQTDNRILFIEDVDERPYRIDRMLVQLLHAGKLDHVRGVVFGQMVHCDPPEDRTHPTSGTTALDAIKLAIEPHLRRKKIPTLYDFPAGHGSPQLTFPIGGEVELRAGPKSAEVDFLEPGVR